MLRTALSTAALAAVFCASAGASEPPRVEEVAFVSSVGRTLLRATLVTATPGTAVVGQLEFDGAPALGVVGGRVTRSGSSDLWWDAGRESWPPGLYTVRITVGATSLTARAARGTPAETHERFVVARAIVLEAIASLASGSVADARALLGTALDQGRALPSRATRSIRALHRALASPSGEAERELRLRETGIVFGLEGAGRAARTIELSRRARRLATAPGLDAADRFEAGALAAEALLLADTGREWRQLLLDVTDVAERVSGRRRTGPSLERLERALLEVERRGRSSLERTLFALDSIEPPVQAGTSHAACTAVDRTLADDAVAACFPGARDDLVTARRCLGYRPGVDAEATTAIRAAYGAALDRLRAEVSR